MDHPGKTHEEAHPLQSHSQWEKQNTGDDEKKSKKILLKLKEQESAPFKHGGKIKHFRNNKQYN
jgi:hypothetical protein